MGSAESLNKALFKYDSLEARPAAAIPAMNALTVYQMEPRRQGAPTPNESMYNELSQSGLEPVLVVCGQMYPYMFKQTRRSVMASARPIFANVAMERGPR